MYGNNSYGDVLYGLDTSAEGDQNIIPPDLMKYMPYYYHKSTVMQNVQRSIALEVGRLNSAKDDLINQLYISSATWGLELWEKEFGIKTDIYKPLEFRRELVKAKLIGTGTVTKSMLKNTALAYTNADVDVAEYPEEFRFVLKFIGVKGIPPNMAGLIETLNNIKPAHLIYSFEYVYSWWGNLLNLKWDKATTYTWNQLKQY